MASDVASNDGGPQNNDMDLLVDAERQQNLSRVRMELLRAQGLRNSSSVSKGQFSGRQHSNSSSSDRSATSAQFKQQLQKMSQE